MERHPIQNDRIRGDRTDSRNRLETFERSGKPQPSGRPAVVVPGLVRAELWLRQRQGLDGAWSGPIQGNAGSTAAYLLHQLWQGKPRSALTDRLAETLIRQQTPGGGWSRFPGESSDPGLTVRCLVALEQIGWDLSAPELEPSARWWSDHARGLGHVDTVTRYFLALLGMIDYAECPNLPLEKLLVPSWSAHSLEHMSHWTRGIYIPLSIWCALRPVGAGHPRIEGRSSQLAAWLSGGSAKRMPSRSRWKALAWVPLRRRSLRAADQWLQRQLVGSDGVGGQLLPTVLSHVALTALGHGDNTALVQSCEELLELLVRPADGSEPSMVQPTLATTRETAWALLSLEALGVPEADASVQRAAHWLLDRQVVHRGDGLSGLAGGWAMQRNNPLGPDVETTGLALLALLRFARQAEPVSIGRHGNLQEAKRQLAHDLWPAVLPARVHAARSTANDWLMSLQNADGGWGQYGYAHGANQRYLVDHHDPWERSAADSTAVVVEQLARGKLASDPACVRGLQYLLDRQQSDGSWSVLWGQGCFDGTARGLIALHAMGLHGHEPPVERAIDYLRGRQQEHGAWPSGQRTQDPRGSVCNTGWCLLALLNYVPASEPLIVRAVDFLLRQQQLEGHWSDRHAVRTLMPGQQWMASSMETHCLVIRALASYAQMSRRQG